MKLNHDEWEKDCNYKKGYSSKLTKAEVWPKIKELGWLENITEFQSLEDSPYCTLLDRNACIDWVAKTSTGEIKTVNAKVITSEYNHPYFSLRSFSNVGLVELDRIRKNLSNGEPIPKYIVNAFFKSKEGGLELLGIALTLEVLWMIDHNFGYEGPPMFPEGNRITIVRWKFMEEQGKWFKYWEKKVGLGF